MRFKALGQDGFYGWITLSASALVYFQFTGLLIYPFGVFMPAICTEFGWSRGTVSGAYTMLMVLMGFSGPLVGMFIAKFGARMAIVVGNIAAALGLLILAFHNQIWQLYVGYGLFIGLGIGFGGFLATTTLANNWFVKRRSLALSIVTASGGLGALIFVPLVMQFILNWGWRYSFGIILAVIFLFSVVLPALVIRNKPEDLNQKPDGKATEHPKEKTAGRPTKLYETPVAFTVKETLRTKTFWLIIVVSVFFNFTISMVFTHQVVYLTDMGITATVAASVLGLLPGFSIFGRMLVGFFGLKINMRPLYTLSLMIMIVGMGLILIAKSLPMIFIYTAVFGTGYGALIVAQTGIVSAYFGQKSYPKIYGLILPFATVSAIGAPVAGFMYDRFSSYSLPFTIATIGLLISLIGFVFATPPMHASLKAVTRESKKTN